MDSLVSTQWLADEMGASDLRIVDASWHLPDAKRDPAAEYVAGHIPGAVYMNLGELVDSNSPLDNTLPGAEKFASRMQSLGLGDGSRLVVYDDSAVKSAARGWFMLKLFGMHDVAILDGTLADGSIDPVVGLLMARGVPFILSSGRSSYDVTKKYSHAVALQKPYKDVELRQALLLALTRGKVERKPVL